jgi:hypothetical protein
MIEKYKFKKMLNEYKSLEYEYKMVKEILRKGHLDFEVFYRQWCAIRDIDLNKLNKDNQEKVKTSFRKGETGIVPTQELKKKTQKHKSVYRALAKKIHPDKLDTSDSRYWKDYMDFKNAVSSIADENWGKLFEIADRHDIYLNNYDEVCDDIEIDIKRITAEIKKEKSSYSWKLYNCKDDKCKDRLIKSFLFQMFGWKE